MTIRDRFTGPLAGACPQFGEGRTAELLANPADCLPLPPAIDRRAWAADALPDDTVRDLRGRAEAELATPWPVPLAHSYARYFRDGDRTGYEQIVFARQQRLTRAAVLAAATLDPVWIDEVADGVTLLCEQSSWCWPAHDDTRRVHGAVVPTVTDPFLDLGAGEVAAQLAWLDHLLGDQLDAHVPGVRARIRHEVERRVFAPFATRRDWHWLGLDGDVHNWSAWIHGNVLVAALRLVDDAARRAHLVDLVVEGLDRYIASLPPDGAVDEGYAYWWNGACRALEALDVLAHATRDTLGDAVPDAVRGIAALRQTIAFPHRVHLGGAWYLNHADSPARSPANQPWHALHRAARLAGDRDAQAHAAAHRRAGTPVAHEDQGLGRLLRALTDPHWLAAVPGSPPLPRDAWFDSTQVLLARAAAGSTAGLTLAVKGGHNGEHHNHNDVGSMVVALGGVPVLVDAGRPTYTAQTFGPDRYRIWTMRSGWHNVPRIRGSEQAHGRRYAAREATVTVDDTRSGLALDLTDAYPRGDVRHWRRDAWLDRATGRVTVRDSWQLDPAPNAEPTVVHLLAAGTVRVGQADAEVDAMEGAGTVRLAWEPAHVPATMTAIELDDPLLREVWGDRLTRIEFDVSALEPAGTLAVTVEEQR
ncbi:heparinase II/III domain-containing protein [Rugosimonospora africana]|uniref:Heparinase n=1 Tax=Rugosimonospora africana TaxID=556532 RepID=A0A8J3VQX6_9ACTN|nr:heparinase II/III family protein [Rugosimonospora africana]GIH14966.1 heparinase [Rugosimonospora africana]